MVFSKSKKFSYDILKRWAGIAQTVYRLAMCWTVWGSKPGGRRDFPHPSTPALGSPSLLYNEYRVFPGGKSAGAWRWLPTPSSVEIKERVELYLYTLSGPSWHFLEWTLPLQLYLQWPWDMFLAKYFSFSLSLWFHRCSILIYFSSTVRSY